MGYIVFRDHNVDKENNVYDGDSVHMEYNDHNVCIGCTVYKAYRIFNVYYDYKEYTENN